MRSISGVEQYTSLATAKMESCLSPIPRKYYTLGRHTAVLTSNIVLLGPINQVFSSLLRQLKDRSLPAHPLGLECYVTSAPEVGMTQPRSFV